MVKKMSVKKYRKLINFDMNLSNEVNLISGGNGTCKSSLLYLISNSYKKVVQSNKTTEIKNCLKIIQQLNNKFNPKIENLTKGDKTHNDPARNVNGNILEVEYFDDSILNFRKHISGQGSESYRYAIKPNYASGSGERLPELPIIYLGLSRLITFGELEHHNEPEFPKDLEESLTIEQKEMLRDLIDSNSSRPLFKAINKNLPNNYIDIINDIYKDFTNIKIDTSEKFTSIGEQKIRPEFTTEVEGIDSNTISSGEDNLYIIITALVSLRFYFECLVETNNEIESILLIDELDATLHPFYQEKLYKLLADYSLNYKIQVVATTHSIDLLEVALEQNQSVVYLIDNLTRVEKLENPTGEKLDIDLIRNFLKQRRYQDDFTKKIAIFSEDYEARLLIRYTLDYIKTLGEEGAKFERADSFLHFVEMNIGAENLRNMFNDSYLINNLVNAFCILDGDQSKKWSKKIITLPGGSNPEELIFNYLEKLVYQDKYNKFWMQPAIIQKAIQKQYVLERIVNKREQIESDIAKMRREGQSTSGVRREKYKKLFIEHEFFLLEVYKYWLKDSSNQKEIDEFIKGFATMFNSLRKVSGITRDLILPSSIPRELSLV
ncbi:AAA family ATPase [Bacillus pumilus]|uniref:AAA family ATPase n=1 Tax=Bacillus pumilus TaxID=1408 RepID=UPI003D1DCF89